MSVVLSTSAEQVTRLHPLHHTGWRLQCDGCLGLYPSVSRALRTGNNLIVNSSTTTSTYMHVFRALLPCREDFSATDVVVNMHGSLFQGVAENFDDLVVAVGSGGTVFGLALANYLTGSKLK